MSDAPFFMMGQFKAVFPDDRLYSPRHLWLQESGAGVGAVPGRYRVGFTSYSVRLLQDVYFLEWSIDPNTQVRDKQEIGEVESAKAISSMFPPCAGKVLQFNPALLNDPSGINADNYGSGWLYEFETATPLLSAHGYVEFLKTAWEDAQKAIKGQINES
jgi:glycine cleavage system H protein